MHGNRSKTSPTVLDRRDNLRERSRRFESEAHARAQQLGSSAFEQFGAFLQTDADTSVEIESPPKRFANAPPHNYSVFENWPFVLA